MDSPPSVASISDGNTNLIAPSETVEEMQCLTRSDFSEDGEAVSEVTAESSAAMRPEGSSALLAAGPQIDPADEESNHHSDSAPDDINKRGSFSYCYRKAWSITLPKVTLSTFTETGQVESSIKVPKQRSYTGRSPIISSSLADTPCATLSIEGVLDQLNVTLGTSHTLTPSLSSLLNECIEKSNDFGTAYACLRPVWNTHSNSSIQNELHRCEEEDKERRQKALVGNRIIDVDYRAKPLPISHAWVDEKDRVDVWTSINGKEWPVPILKGASLELIWIEMLNLGLEYTWLDVLCLRQKGGPQEDLHAEEWKLDVPTIGYVYSDTRIVIYLSGLGQPLTLKDGDLDSDQCWFRCAWTIQEVGDERIIAGDTPDRPMHARTIDEDGNYETELLTRFHKKLELVQEYRSLFGCGMLAHMQKRVSTNPVDKVAGLAFPLYPITIPAYYESESLEDA
ncbi:uncharacterized protein ARMOST_20839 [Armillaria ostoyae]|uniref:Heterokaryon incompatibility domain-containing protein n=1 Tax=Armillaria ostoyae TaxID=47428 RepID=A0A284S8F4_ARMOS|nr:uncharacterized protein ARMOST_20839 [Armillaria ostoyae]